MDAVQNPNRVRPRWHLCSGPSIAAERFCYSACLTSGEEVHRQGRQSALAQRILAWRVVSTRDFRVVGQIDSRDVVPIRGGFHIRRLIFPAVPRNARFCQQFLARALSILVTSCRRWPVVTLRIDRGAAATTASRPSQPGDLEVGAFEGVERDRMVGRAAGHRQELDLAVRVWAAVPSRPMNSAGSKRPEHEQVTSSPPASTSFIASTLRSKVSRLPAGTSSRSAISLGGSRTTTP